MYTKNLFYIYNKQNQCLKTHFKKKRFVYRKNHIQVKEQKYLKKKSLMNGRISVLLKI